MNDGELQSMDKTTIFRLKFNAIISIFQAKSFMVITNRGTTAMVHPAAAEDMMEMYDNNTNNLRELARMHSRYSAANGGGNEDNQSR